MLRLNLLEVAPLKVLDTNTLEAFHSSSAFWGNIKNLLCRICATRLIFPALFSRHNLDDLSILLAGQYIKSAIRTHFRFS